MLTFLGLKVVQIAPLDLPFPTMCQTFTSDMILCVKIINMCLIYMCSCTSFNIRQDTTAEMEFGGIIPTQFPT